MNLNLKEHNEKSYKINSKYKRHTGPGVKFYKKA